MEAEKSKSKLGIGAYLALIFAIIFFSGLAKNEQFVKMLPDKQWVTAASVFDFGTLNGSFGKVLTSATAKPDGKIETKSGNFRGAGGNGAMDGFMFALGLIPTVMFALAVINVLEGYGALEAARQLLTPLLRPLMGIPGTAALGIISSLQSTDAGASMTRALYDEGGITEKEKDIFTMFQFSAGATLTNFFSTGAILFTLTLADGKIATPVTMGLCVGVMLLFKVFGANLMRLYWTFIVEPKEKTALATK